MRIEMRFDRMLLLTLLVWMGVIALFCQSAHCQAAYLVDKDTGVIKTSGGTFTHLNKIGEITLNFEFLFNNNGAAGSPTSSTVTIVGCGRGNTIAYGQSLGLNQQPVQSSTCDTLDTYTANANAVRKVNGFYENYIVTFTPVGGTNPTLQINEFGTAASSPLSPNDPCQSSAFAKKSVAVNISSATTTELVAAVSGLQVYVCGIYASAAGTSPTFQFEYGTKSSTPCDTGATALSGTIAASTTVPLELATGLSNLTAPQGKELCAVSAGTGPSFQGLLTYVQAP